MRLETQFPSSNFDNLENYRHIKFFTTTAMEPEVYIIKKIKVELTPEALREVQHRLQRGEVWIATGKAELAGKGVKEKHVKQIFKQQTVNGALVYKDITQKKIVRELTTQEMDELSKIINQTIEVLNNEKPPSKTPERITPSLSPQQTPPKQRFAQEPVFIKKSPKKLQKERHDLKIGSHRINQEQRNKKQRERKELSKELDEKADERKVIQKKWDNRQETNKEGTKKSKIKSHKA